MGGLYLVGTDTHNTIVLALSVSAQMSPVIVRGAVAPVLGVPQSLIAEVRQMTHRVEEVLMVENAFGKRDELRPMDAAQEYMYRGSVIRPP